MARAPSLLADPADPTAVEAVSDNRLLERLGALQGARGLPRLVFLAACESASPDADAAFGGLAQRLVRDLGVPAVVAMADKVEVTTANALGSAFYARLIEHGEVDRALVEATAGLAEQGDVMVPVLFSRLGGRAIFSEAADRVLSSTEINTGLERLQPLLVARAPVLLTELERAALVLRRTLEVDPSALAPELRRERMLALETVDALCAEATELRFVDLAAGKAPPSYDDRCPFPGLRAFASSLRAFFFGREPLVQRLLERINAHPALAVLGASGSGKSSVVFAGLAPALEARQPGLRVLSLTPGAQPMESLRAALAQPTEGDPASATLLIVDQFEEVFTLGADDAERQAFFAALLDLPAAYKLVLTMRADFWGEVAPYPQLRTLMQTHQELVAPMSPDELRRAMELQAVAVGLRFEADLAAQILDDVRGEPGAMPLLQHALQELWQRRRGRWLRSAEYRAIGGIHQAIAHTADAIYSAATPPERERLRDIFVRLTRIDRADAGTEERRDTRQRVAFSELVPAGMPSAPVRELVRRLADARLVVTGVATSGGETVEVAHEALIRSWPRLRSWLEEDRQSLLLRDAIRQAALEWASTERDEDLLFRGSRLDDALAHSRLPRFAPNELEQAFLDAATDLRAREEAARDEQQRRELAQAQALAEEQRQRAEESTAAARQLRSRAVFLAGVAVVALVAMVAAGLFGVQSRRAEARAEASAAEARARALTANARAAQVFGQPDLSLALAVEAARSEPPLPESFNVLASVAENAARWQFQAGAAVRNVFFMPNGQMLGIARQISSPSGVALLTPEGQPADFGLGPIADPRTGSLNVDYLSLAALSPDGSTLFAYYENFAQDDSSGAILWSLSGGTVVSDLEQLLFGTPTHAVFHPAGQWVIVALSDGRLVQIDVTTHRVVGTFATVAAVEVPPDGPFPAAGSQFVGLAVSPDGATVAVLQNTGHVELLRYADGTALTILEEPGRTTDPKPFSGLAYSPDGTLLASAGSGGAVRVWRPGEEGASPMLLSHADAVSALAYSPDGALLAVGRIDGLIQLWDLASGVELRRYVGYRAAISGNSAVSALAFHPNGRALLSGSTDGNARLWDINSGFLVADLRGEPLDGWQGPGVAQVAFSTTDNLLIRDETGRARRWAPASAEVGSLLDLASAQVVALSASVPRALSYDPEQNELQVWDTDQAALLASFVGDSTPSDARFGTPSMWIFPDGERFVIAQFDGQMLLRSLSDGTVLHELCMATDDGWLPSVGFARLVISADGAIAAATGDKVEVTTVDLMFTSELMVWDLASGRLVLGLQISDATTTSALAISPDGALIATGMGDGSVKLWRTRDGTLVQTLLGHVGPVSSATFSPDGAMLITGSSDRSLRLWDLASGSELRAISTAPRIPSTLAVNTAGDRLLVGDTSGGASLWRIESGQALVDWTLANRAVIELNCQQRERYQLEPCIATSATAATAVP
ncbi:MAG: CHAT domain-containing protein [Oscillochloridaceae bacterium umkhey_bin13]